jgi:hypothetical protein
MHLKSQSTLNVELQSFIVFFLTPGLYFKITALFCTSSFLVDQVKISSLLQAFVSVLEKHSVYFCDADCDDIHNAVHDLQKD